MARPPSRRPQRSSRGGSPQRRANSRAPLGPPKGKVSGSKRAPTSSLELPAKGLRQVIGLHSVREVFQVRPRSVKRLWLRAGWETSQDLAELGQRAQQMGIPMEVTSVEQLERLGSGHQGLCVAVSESPLLDWDQVKGAEKMLLLALDGVEDPHNLGAILRTSWLMGVAGVIIPEMRSVGLTPTVAKVACGGAEHVPLEVETNLAAVLERLREAGFWIFGLEASDSSRQLWDLELPDKVVWVLGSEEKGLRSPVRRACDEGVQIPQLEARASYNVSVACAMALAETLRQWNLSKNIGK